MLLLLLLLFPFGGAKSSNPMQISQELKFGAPMSTRDPASLLRKEIGGSRGWGLMEFKGPVLCSPPLA